MPNWGVTEDGFYRPTQQELLADRESEQRAIIDPELDLGAETVLGQTNGIDTRQEAFLWELGQVLYHAIDPDAAEGAQFENLSKLSGTRKRGARPSYVDANCSLTSGTTLQAGIHFAAVDGAEDVRFTPVEDFAAPSTGLHLIRFQSENTGPIPCASGKLTVIATTVVGWNSVTNPSDAILGADIETIEEMRKRRDDEIAAAGGSTAIAIRADVRKVDEEKIQSVYVLVNDGPTTDGNGLPPNSYEVIIYDGGLVANDLIAQAIYETGGEGIRTYGSAQGNAVDPDTKETRVIHFSRAVEVPVYIVATFEKLSGYPGDADAKTAWAAAANAHYEPGEDVIGLWVRGYPLNISGVEDVDPFAIGTAPAPTLDDNLTITVRQIARFSSDRITINA